MSYVFIMARQPLWDVVSPRPLVQTTLTSRRTDLISFPLSLFFEIIPKVIYRALPPWRKVDPYGPAAQHQLMITNLRVRLLQRQPCPCQAKDLEAAVLPTDHYAIYDFIVKGSCLCNGHADHCVPSRGFRAGQQKTGNMVRDLHYRAEAAAAP